MWGPEFSPFVFPNMRTPTTPMRCAQPTRSSNAPHPLASSSEGQPIMVLFDTMSQHHQTFRRNYYSFTTVEVPPERHDTSEEITASSKQRTKAWCREGGVEPQGPKPG